jgi:hypothetical protein
MYDLKNKAAAEDSMAKQISSESLENEEPRLRRGGERKSGVLIGLTLEMWREVDDRPERLKALNFLFHEVQKQLFASAEWALDGFEGLTDHYRRWRRIVIWATGGVATLNVLAAFGWDAKSGIGPVLSLISAVAAVTLTVLSNLESFGNSAEKAQGYRTARELFLDAAGDLEQLWNTHVLPLGDKPEACMNATELYRRAVAREIEVRNKAKELTKTRDKKK